VVVGYPHSLVSCRVRHTRSKAADSLGRRPIGSQGRSCSLSSLHAVRDLFLSTSGIPSWTQQAQRPCSSRIVPSRIQFFCLQCEFQSRSRSAWPKFIAPVRYSQLRNGIKVYVPRTVDLGNTVVWKHSLRRSGRSRSGGHRQCGANSYAHPAPHLVGSNPPHAAR
jgi:hypothetical protein